MARRLCVLRIPCLHVLGSEGSAARVVGKPAGKLGVSGNGEPTRESMPVNAVGFTSIFVGVIPMALTDDQLHVMLGTKAQIGWYHGKDKFGHAKILIPNGDASGSSFETRFIGIRPQTSCSKMAEF